MIEVSTDLAEKKREDIKRSYKIARTIDFVKAYFLDRDSATAAQKALDGRQFLWTWGPLKAQWFWDDVLDNLLGMLGCSLSSFYANRASQRSERSHQQEKHVKRGKNKLEFGCGSP